MYTGAVVAIMADETGTGGVSCEVTAVGFSVVAAAVVVMVVVVGESAKGEYTG